MSNFLSRDELIELTGFTWKSKQLAALAQMGVRFTVNPRGRILVARVVLTEQPRIKAGPNWAGIKGKAA